ncbi:MAG: ABC transporter permease subunit [Alphaproteobacteria bacterium]|nr:MAG: ABC transporter permease subunit [Alphaproteobacteria bacterium]
MARSAQPVRLLPGWIGLAAVLALTLGPLIPLGLQAGAAPGFGGPEWGALRFTLLQSGLSAGLSCLGGVVLARALSRQRFPGRRLLLSVMGAPFILPAIVAVLALSAVWGRSGILSDVLAALGLGRLDIYGLPGVVLAHVFFNLPLVTRLVLQELAAVPAEHWRLAAHLGLSRGTVFRYIEWPAIRTALPGAFVLVFLLSVTSFAVVLALGGGPGAATLELEIYQALSFDFDPGRAAMLALAQYALCLSLGLVALRLARQAGFGPGLDLALTRLDGAAYRRADALVIGLGGLFLLTPLAMLAARGVEGLIAGLPAATWPAARLSLVVALSSSALGMALALAMAALIAGLRRAAPARARLIEAAGFLALTASPFALGAGIFLALRPVVDPFALAVPVLIAVNAVMALPFSLRILLPALERVEADYGRLAASLGLAGWSRLRYLTLPRLRRPAGFAAGLAAAFSMGDLGVIALFAPPDLATLPLAIHRLMGAYRMQAAMGVALMLVGLCLVIFVVFERLGAADDRA